MTNKMAIYSADVYRNLDRIKKIYATNLFELLRNIKIFISSYKYKWPVGNFRIEVFKGKKRELIGKYITYQSQEHKQLVRQPIIKVTYVWPNDNEIINQPQQVIRELPKWQ